MTTTTTLPRRARLATLLGCCCAWLTGCASDRGVAAAQGPGPIREVTDIRLEPPDECERRAAAMAQQAEEMHRGDLPSDGAEERERGLQGNSPCDTIRHVDTSQHSEDARIRAMARAKSLLSQGRPIEARRALVPAFERDTLAQVGLRNLALDIHEALQEVEPHAQPACALRDMNEASAPRAVTVEGPAQLVLSCQGLKETPSAPGAPAGEVRVVLRRRDAPGAFSTLEERDLGPLAALDDPVQQSFTLPKDAAPTQAAYYDIMVTVGAPGRPSDRVEQVGLFWFGR